MKKILAFACFFVSVQLFGQQLQVMGNEGKLYLQHTVAPKENWYSIGRIYNISPRDMAPFNNLSIQNPLSIGESLKVPLTAVNFSQDGKKNADEALIPLYHTVKEKEGLFRISQTFNKVPVASLKSWNNISGETVPVGTHIIVGYLKVKKDLSPLAGANYVAPVVTTPAVETKPVVKTENEKPVVKEEVKKPVEEAVKKPEVKKEEPKVTEPVKPVVATPAKPVESVSNIKTKPGGYFADDYNAQTSNGKNVQTITGNGSLFKSTSGWTDARYYVLINKVEPGTIVKVSSQGKYIYAKVLGALPEIKQNEGLLFRISNAAAKELNVTDKFTADISWEK
jgi:LysM repeat protein